MTTTKTPNQICPYCGRDLKTKTVVDPKTGIDPSLFIDVGALCLCYYCGEISKFDQNLVLVRLTPKELVVALREHPWWNKEQKKIIAMARIK